jgi:hypothetical protein
MVSGVANVPTTPTGFKYIKNSNTEKSKERFLGHSGNI